MQLPAITSPVATSLAGSNARAAGGVNESPAEQAHAAETGASQFAMALGQAESEPDRDGDGFHMPAAESDEPDDAADGNAATDDSSVVTGSVSEDEQSDSGRESETAFDEDALPLLLPDMPTLRGGRLDRRF